MVTAIQNKTEDTKSENEIAYDGILVYRTDIKNKKKLKKLRPFLDQHPLIKHWTVDLEDVDKVLRLETSAFIQEKEIINLLNTCGFECLEFEE